MISTPARDGDLYGVTWNPIALPSDGAQREYSIGTGNTTFFSFWFERRKQYLAGGRTKLDAPNLLPKHMQQ